MDNDQAFVVLLYNVLHIAVLCLPWNGGRITDPQQSSGHYIVFNVLHYSKPHGWLHSAWSNANNYDDEGIILRSRTKGPRQSRRKVPKGMSTSDGHKYEFVI
ncbi:hypothetical protein C2845_PM16G04030 [Panicum miliaceum]|uniref:Uncharacterized protein n=1 Tax=Panicum miliaceum TaxID=4540 RepID=A0A3L6PXC6_PANMI|nr:hypothetical protein C2845_PM16G04030 [Panicum miliaceum]